MKKILLLILLLIPQKASAFTECLTVDTSSWTQEERTKIAAMSPDLFNPPAIPQIEEMEGNQIRLCADIPQGTIFPFNSEGLLLSIKEEAEKDKQEATMVEEAHSQVMQSLKNKLKNLGFTDEEMQAFKEID